MELKKIKDLVTKMLEEREELRGNDDLLYLEVIKKVHPAWNNGRITTNVENMTIGEFFKNRKTAGLPNFESVRRSRALIQSEHPELKPSEKIQEGRRRAEEKFYDYSKLKQQSFNF